MVIPKSFEDLQDLEAMLLTSILGVLVALKEDLISFKQAESYWLSDFMADIFEEMKLSEGIVKLLQESSHLKELQGYTKLYYEKVDKLIVESKNLISKYYTEYEDEDGEQFNEKSMLS